MNESKNILLYFVLLLTLFVLIFFTQDYYFNYNLVNEELEQLNTKLEKLEKQNKKLAIDKKNFSKKD
jgi:cell division protein FtsB